MADKQVNADWNTKERQMATEITLNALLVTLHEAGQLPHAFRGHLDRATNQAEELMGDVFPDLIAALDEKRQYLAALLHAESSDHGCS